MKRSYINKLKLVSALTLMLLSTPLCMTACSDDDDDDAPATEQPSASGVKLESSDPVNGATEVYKYISSIELTYTDEVKFVSGVTATFNGQNVNIVNFVKSGNKVTFKFPDGTTLADGQSYTLSIPEGFFTDKNGNSVAAHSVSFTTAEKKAPTERTLCTPNPMAQTEAIFEYFNSIYGQKILTASMANVAWNFDEANLIKTATGKYPAIATMDFIQIYTNRTDWDNQYWVVDYSVSNETKEWAANGGLIGASWHWMVPAERDQIPSSTAKMTTRNKETVFKPSNMLKEGTWERTIRNTELPMIADRLLALQDAGITVLWRPYHEAAGNFRDDTGNTGSGTWFWWGCEGPEVYKEIWKDMFNYFRERGINNLIWVWTTQTGYDYRNDKISTDSQWYPGDDFVDIVGRDKYGDTDNLTTDKILTQCAEEFAAIVEAFPNKMVTLSECGSVPDLSAQWAAGAQWLFAMPWYDYDADNTAKSLDNHCHANTTWWKNTMNFEQSVDRDAVKAALMN